MNLLRIKIEGLNKTKVLNALMLKGVCVSNLREKKNVTTFEISEKDEVVLNSICKKYHKKYEIISKYKLINILKKSKYYLGFILAFVIVFSFLYSFNLFYYQINLKVSSNINFDLTGVEKILSEKNIYAGMRKNNLDAKELQKLILMSQDNVSGCEIKSSGGKLDIIIYPAVLKENITKENIYSQFDAIVTKVDVFSGDGKVKAGDLVRKGDLLIENNNGASGEILGKIYYSDYILYNENQMVKEFTGRVIEKKDILVFNKILAKSNKNIVFSNYLEEICVFSVSKNLFLPISIQKTCYREYELKDVFLPFENVENKLKKEIYDEVFKSVMFKDKITGVNYSVVREDNLVRLDCFIECEINLLDCK